MRQRNLRIEQLPTIDAIRRVAGRAIVNVESYDFVPVCGRVATNRAGAVSKSLTLQTDGMNFNAGMSWPIKVGGQGIDMKRSNTRKMNSTTTAA